LQQQLLLETKPYLTRGSTNSNIPIAKGIPAVTIGRGGDGGKAHSLDEWWINKEGYKAIQLALLILTFGRGWNKVGASACYCVLNNLQFNSI